jgi:hypothetical protein
MKKILSFLVALGILFSPLQVRADDVSSLWKKAGSALLPLNSSWTVGSSTTRLAKLWVTDLDISGVFTFGGTMGGDLNMNGYNIVGGKQVKFGTGQAVTATDYVIARNADATNLMQFNVPTGSGFKFSINGSTGMLADSTGFSYIRTSDDAVAPEVFFKKTTTTPAPGDEIGILNYLSQNDNAPQDNVIYAWQRTGIASAVTGSEAGIYVFGVQDSGSIDINNPSSYLIMDGAAGFEHLRFFRTIYSNITGSTARTPIDIQYGATVSPSQGLINVQRFGNTTMSGVMMDLNITPSFILTEPAVGFNPYYGAYIDMSNVSVTADAGGANIYALNLKAATDTDAASSSALQAYGKVLLNTGGIDSKILQVTSTNPTATANTFTASTISTNNVSNASFVATYGNANVSGANVNASTTSSGLTTAGNGLSGFSSLITTSASDASNTGMTAFIAMVNDTGGNAGTFAYTAKPGFDLALKIEGVSPIGWWKQNGKITAYRANSDGDGHSITVAGGDAYDSGAVARNGGVLNLYGGLKANAGNDGYVKIGQGAGTPTETLTDDDLYVLGQLEVDGTARFDKIVNIYNTVTGGTSLNIDYSVNSISAGAGRGIDLGASGALTGLAGFNTGDLYVKPTLAITDPGSGTFTYNNLFIDMSGMSVVAGAGSTNISGLKIQGAQIANSNSSNMIDLVGSGTSTIQFTPLGQMFISASDYSGMAIDINHSTNSTTGGSPTFRLIRSGTYTGLDTETDVAFGISGTSQLTDPAAGTYSWVGQAIDVSGISLTAGAGDTYVTGMNITINTDTDFAGSVGLSIDAGSTVAPITATNILGFNNEAYVDDPSGAFEGAGAQFSVESMGLANAGTAFSALDIGVINNVADVAGTFLGGLSFSMNDNGGSGTTAGVVMGTGFDYGMIGFDSDLKLATLSTTATAYNVQVKMPTITTGAADQNAFYVEQGLNDSNVGTNSYRLIEGLLTDTDVTAWDNGAEVYLLDLYTTNGTGIKTTIGGEVMAVLTTSTADESAGFVAFRNDVAPQAGDLAGYFAGASYNDNTPQDDVVYGGFAVDIGLPTTGSETGKTHFLVKDSASADLETPTPYITLDGTVGNENIRFLVGEQHKVTTVNAATYDLLTTDYFLHVTYTGTGAVTSLTLPTAQVKAGRTIVIKDAGGNASVNNITIDTEGSETIDGAATYVISSDYDAINLYSDGSNWFIY